MILLHAKCNTPTAAVSNTVATKEPSSLCGVTPCVAVTYISFSKQRAKRNEETYVTDDFVEEEVVQLAENKEHSGEDVIPDRSKLVEHAENNVQHETEVQQSSAAAQQVSNVGAEMRWLRTYAPGHIVVKTNKGTLCSASGGLEGPRTEVIVKPTSRAM